MLVVLNRSTLLGVEVNATMDTSIVVQAGKEGLFVARREIRAIRALEAASPQLG